MRIATGAIDARSEETIEEEVGALLTAEVGLDVHALREMYAAVHKK